MVGGKRRMRWSRDQSDCDMIAKTIMNDRRASSPIFVMDVDCFRLTRRVTRD